MTATAIIAIICFIIMCGKYFGLVYKYDNLKIKYYNQKAATKKYRQLWMAKCGYIEKD